MQDKTKEYLGYASRYTSVVTGVTAIWETIATQQFKMGYLIDGIAISAGVPLMTGAAIATSAIGLGAAGQLIDFVANGVDAFKFKDFASLELGGNDKHAGLKIAAIMGGFIGGLIGCASSIVGGIPEIVKKSHELQGDLFTPKHVERMRSVDPKTYNSETTLDLRPLLTVKPAG